MKLIVTRNQRTPKIRTSPLARYYKIARVFRQELIRFIKVIKTYHIFGSDRYWMYTIEWQKQGLPFSHNLIWLHDRIHPTGIDEMIQDEIANPQKDPELTT